MKNVRMSYHFDIFLFLIKIRCKIDNIIAKKLFGIKSGKQICKIVL